MRIAVVSDTHGNVANFRKAIGWIKKENIRLILHCGDIGSLESLKESLAGFDGEFLGVFGNMDKDYKIEIKEYNKIPGVKIEENILEREIDNNKIAVTHKPEDAKNLAQTGKYDLVFYGHTHKPWDKKIEKCHVINPGELAGQFYKPAFAVFDTATGKLELEILEKLE